MNDYGSIPDGYDFHWSSCVIEHLGGIRKALDFVLESVERLWKQLIKLALVS